jgi:hypothetical protein
VQPIEVTGDNGIPRCAGSVVTSSTASVMACVKSIINCEATFRTAHAALTPGGLAAAAKGARSLVVPAATYAAR